MAPKWVRKVRRRRRWQGAAFDARWSAEFAPSPVLAWRVIWISTRRFKKSALVGLDQECVRAEPALSRPRSTPSSP